MPAGDLEISLFGAFRVVADGVVVEESRWGNRRKAKTLVKILAIEPTNELPRERLLDALWPELEPEQALNSFHKTLYAARRALEPNLKAAADSRFLITAEKRILLRAPGTLRVDAVEFERLAASALSTAPAPSKDNLKSALGVASGELLSEDRLEDWAEIRRDRIVHLQQELLMRLAEIEESQGNLRAAIDCLSQSVDLQPVNEVAHRQLMRLHAKAGNRHLAINQYKLCADVLRRELDAETEIATQRLFEQIQEGQIALTDIGMKPAAAVPETPVPTGPIAPTNTAAPSDARSPSSPPPAPSSAASTRRRVWLIASGGAALAALGGFAAVSRWRENRDRTARNNTRSVAVLPLSTSSNEQIEYLADGLTEELINNLSRLHDLRVMARSTVYAYKDKASDPREVGRAIGVGLIVTGRMSQSPGQDLAIDVELVDSGDGARIWGARYTFRRSEYAGMQTRIASDVAAALPLRSRGDSQRLVSRNYTGNSAAYDLYLRGRHELNQRTKAGFERAIGFFQQAIDLDPRYALAYAGLADCYGLLGFEDDPPKHNFPKARAMAQQALELDPELSEAHTSLAMVSALFDWNWSKAESEFRLAIELNPNHATAHHWYAVHLNGQGRVREATERFAKALELDPLSRIINTNSVYPEHFQRKFDEAIRRYRKVLELDSTFLIAREDLMIALEQAGRMQEAALEAIQVVQRTEPEEFASQFRAAVQSHGYQNALRLLRNRKEKRSRQTYVPPSDLAHLAIRTGDPESAFRWLNKSLEDRGPALVYLKVNPMYDPLRSDRRFASLVQQIGL